MEWYGHVIRSESTAALSGALRIIEDIKLERGRPPTYWQRSSEKIMAEKGNRGWTGGAPKDTLALAGILLEGETPQSRPSDDYDDDEDEKTFLSSNPLVEYHSNEMSI